LVLAVGIDDQDVLAGGRADALVVRMPDHPRPASRRGRARAVLRPVVDDEDLVPGGGVAESGDDFRDDVGLVVGRDHD
jgi:hypothetical protein